MSSHDIREMSRNMLEAMVEAQRDTLGEQAARIASLEAERDQLRAEVERMDFIEKEFGDVLLLELAKDLPRADMPFREAIDLARTAHKDEG